MKTSKGGRKISLPWFRQQSVQQSHAALSRQHTIDTPGSFRSYVGSKKLQVNLISVSLNVSILVVGCKSAYILVDSIIYVLKTFSFLMIYDLNLI